LKKIRTLIYKLGPLQRPNNSSELLRKFDGISRQYPHFKDWLSEIVDAGASRLVLKSNLKDKQPATMQTLVNNRRKLQKVTSEVVSAAKTYYNNLRAWERSTHEGLTRIKTTAIPSESKKAVGTHKKTSELIAHLCSLSWEAVKLGDTQYVDFLKEVASKLSRVMKFLRSFIDTYTVELGKAQTELKRLQGDADFDTTDADATKEAIAEFKFEMPIRINDTENRDKKWPPVEDEEEVEEVDAGQ
jgi:hypothetical protein